jgi:hypothetical protein
MEAHVVAISSVTAAAVAMVATVAACLASCPPVAVAMVVATATNHHYNWWRICESPHPIDAGFLFFPMICGIEASGKTIVSSNVLV